MDYLELFIKAKTTKKCIANSIVLKKKKTKKKRPT